jgi:hypothetical protein
MGTLLTLGALALLPAGASAALPDASCPGPTTSMTAHGKLAQTFTAQRTGGIVSGQMFVSKTSPEGDFLMEIFRADANGPTGGAIGSTVVPDSSVPNGMSTAVNGTFAVPAPVTAGGSYAIALGRTGGVIFRDRSGNPCPGNEFSFAAGVWDLVNPTYDLPFSVMVEPSNEISLKSQQGRTITLTVPNAGTLSVAGVPAGGKGAAAKKRKRRALIKPAQATATGPGDVTVALALTKAGKQRFKQKGQLRSAVTVTFSPTGGQPKSIDASVKLKRKKKKG